MVRDLPLSILLLILAKSLLFGLVAWVLMTGVLTLVHLLWFKHRHRIQLDFRILPAEPEDVPEKFCRLAKEARQALDAAGFIWLGYYRLHDYITQQEIWYSLGRHPEYQGVLAATSAHFRPRSGRKPLFRLGYTSLSSNYANTHSVLFCNAAMNISPNPKRQYVPFTGPVSAMVGFFLRAIAEHPLRAQPERIPEGQEVECLEQQMRRDIEELVKEGHFTIAEGSKQACLTWKGTFQMVLPNTRPFSRFYRLFRLPQRSDALKPEAGLRLETARADFVAPDWQKDL
ncbi:MAG: hypothetical protein ACAI44_38345 [Candidatus Sericytochromatia bacterium]